MKASIKALAVAAGLSCALAVTPVNATGIPVVDGANLNQNLTNYMQYLTSYSTQLEDLANQVKQYQQLMDTYKEDVRQFNQNVLNPGVKFFKSVGNTYKEIKHAVDGIVSIKAQYERTIDYIKDNYGDSDFWLQCAKTGCNPLNQLERSTESTINNLEFSLGSIERINDMVVENDAYVQSIMERLNTADPGLNTTLVSMAELCAQGQQTASATHRMMASALAAQNTKALEEERQRQFNIKQQQEFLKDKPKKVSKVYSPADFFH